MRKSLSISGLFLLTFSLFICNAVEIHDHGYWMGDDVKDNHIFDSKLADGLVEFFHAEEATYVGDFGCGMGNYVRHLIDNGINSIGYDGFPDTLKVTNGLCEVLDLSIPQNLETTFDWVLSLEVGEHLPAQFETIFIENLIRHSKYGIVLSWAVKGQGGCGHFNEQSNDYIKQIFSQYGFENDEEVEQKLRKKSHLTWFKNTIMVFRLPQ